MRSKLVLRFIFGGIAVLLVLTVFALYLNDGATLLAASQDKGKGAQGDESKGFRAQVTARIIGPGDNINFFFTFSGIKTTVSAYTDMRPYTIMAGDYGSVTITGSYTCTYQQGPCTKTIECVYNGLGLHSGSLPYDPAFTLELWDQGDGTVRYRFNICMDDMDYLMRCTIDSVGPPDPNGFRQCYPSRIIETKDLIGIQIGSNPPLDKFNAHGGHENMHYLLSLADHTAHTIQKGDKCIADYDIYPLEPRSRQCPAWVHVAWNIMLEEVEVEIDKCDDGWRPEKDGDPVAITARIVKPEGAAGIFRFTLSDISNEPGYCMNDGDEDEADLAFIWEPDKFEPPEYLETGSDVPRGNETKEPGGDVESVMGVPDEVMETRQAVNSATVKIQPKDYGAYGKLMAEVNFCGVWYPAKVKGEDEYSIDIPLDDDGNHIADGCRKWDKSGAPGDEDKDFIPDGDGFDGDGLTNYEEYRGFMVKEGGKKKWLATDPKTKDLFICFEDPALSWGYFDVSRLALHEIDEDGFHGIDSRVVNYNNKTHHAVDQHGIHMKSETLDGALGATFWEPSSSGVETPKDVEVVKIDVAGHLGSQPDLMATQAHELGHCVNIKHHGDGNLEDVPLSTLLNDPAFSNYYDILKDDDPSNKYNIAVYHGQNSGASECFMRYYIASFYKRDDRQIYLYPDFDMVAAYLCYDGDGSGWNAPTPDMEIVTNGITRVFPMCGDAAEGRGGCVFQIRVNDKE